LSSVTFLNQISIDEIRYQGFMDCKTGFQIWYHKKKILDEIELVVVDQFTGELNHFPE